ncbi:effector binding domain-containing protein [uncultured Sunxiuqinia sp.]|uniref:GyrI-like domain-containing protein n=1 Tax=uncultured Sunxiuqinia sp. TaxID=1573825 RepID=UPI002AA7B8E4|nr:effector binding domain-containing protein [uncultured Sunxiuqinia sp.]
MDFNPLKELEKWAAVEVSDFDEVPEEMDRLVVPQGQYSIFQYKGKPSEAQKTFQYIYGVGLPGSIYEMDDRPYLDRMGEKYHGEDSNSEEEFWIPIRKK